ncbi:PREDICTED: uncharacterized protein LOC105452664 isoform X2 [Wasmannia auropunctata]|uniref:uncharacterized protein LOC105452664 isoform X2 n=1 Tax=Wasmannia auropunctata TaxID=64793 RepID=UPI0005EDA245|nr:PREDICTED: uncharacterized protein LOC105452664 isoform X2 [Wasmannia auropunctata]
MLNVASFERCVLELIANSLNADASAIAVRIHAGKREIHVVDNGVGIPKDVLKRTVKCDAEAVGNRQQVRELPETNYLTNICLLSDRLTIASRYQYSTETFMKVSFSIRDEERKKVVLRIAKPHSPAEVLRTLFGKDLSLRNVWSIQCSPESGANYHGYVGLSDKNAMQWFFFNHRPIYCPLILNLIKIVFKERLNLSCDQESNTRDLYNENMFILFFLTLSRKEFTLVTESGERYIMFYNMQKILNVIKNCAFKCLADEAVVSIPYLCKKTQLLKRTYLKIEKSVFNNGINGRYQGTTSENVQGKNVPYSMMRNESAMISVKRRKITSTVTSTNCFNKQPINDNTEAASRYIDKRNNILNNIRCQVNVASVKRANLYEDKAVKKMRNGVDEMQRSSMNVTDNSSKSDKNHNHRNDDNNDFTNMISPLSEWSNWTYYTNNEKRDSAKKMNDTFSENDIRIRQLFERNNQFDFLPRKLYGLLQHRHVKLTNVKCFDSPNDTIPRKSPFIENWQHEQIAVHPCKMKRKLCEFRLSRASLKCIKIINQVNDEFIAAWMTWNEMKILLMIDQHAAHERIRYENLLLRYKVQNEDELLSINLREPLFMEFPTEMCNSLIRNKMLLRKYGISLGSSKENMLIIRAIPQCLITNSDPSNSEKILPKILGLLNDVLKNCNTSQTNALPLTIHNAIASEACHGAIKFGNRLTLQQCTSLIKLLNYTKFPNRCAHGRPTIIPMIEFSELGKRSARIPEKKLNFTSLKRTTKRGKKN